MSGLDRHHGRTERNGFRGSLRMSEDRTSTRSKLSELSPDGFDQLELVLTSGEEVIAIARQSMTLLSSKSFHRDETARMHD